MKGRLTHSQIPNKLYKYRDWANSFHCRLISNQEVYFAKPSEFNDPFDGNIPIRWDLMTYEECFERNLELINTIHKNKDQALVRSYAKKITDEKKLWHPENISKESPQKIEKWSRIIGLLSLTSVPDNILMWSHYSSNHTGFVVGFNTEILLANKEFDYLEPIVYQKEYPIISGMESNSEQFYKKFFHKSELWSYEQEWRITINHINKRVIRLAPEVIKEIIIGCCADDKQTMAIIKLVKKHLLKNIQIFKAVKAKDSFGLELVKIN